MYILLVIVLLITATCYLILHLPVFGRKAKGRRLQRLKALPNYRNGRIVNLSLTPMKPDDVSYMDMIKGMLKSNPDRRPSHALPFLKPDFTQNGATKIIWFGHSSYLIQVNRVNILVDPVFSPSTSPFSFIGNKNFDGTDFLRTEDLPALDIIMITHDHYDHLDYQTILKLKDKTQFFVTSLGVGAHLERWNIPAEKIIELSWSEEKSVLGIKVIATPARHFTGRGLQRNTTLWSSFIINTDFHKLYLGGDSGYDDHFKTIGETYGPFDLAILECGQYNGFWPYIHMFPEQAVQAAADLNADIMMPVHWGKFSLAMHAWDEPINRVVAEAAKREIKLATPLLGESVILGEAPPQSAWWRDNQLNNIPKINVNGLQQ